MPQLLVTAKRLNKRRVIPSVLPDPQNKAGEVFLNDTFEGEEVTSVPNTALGKWYKDRDGFFYWGGGVKEQSQIAAFLPTTVIIPAWIKKIDLEKIWNDYDERGERAKIAILDSGFNEGIRDIASGVKDSKVFFNSVAGTPVSINDNFGHGTHCASLIGGRNNDNVTGCAPASSMYIAKICSQGSVRSFSIVVDAIRWAINNQVDIISISYGGATRDNALEAIIDEAVNVHNIFVIASIGDIIPNSAVVPCFPALFANCLAVGATDDQQKISAITVVDNKTEINAPGESIPGYTLDPLKTVNMSGTSQASAIVAGIAALIISRFKKLNRNYTAGSIKKLIVDHSIPITDNPGQKLINPGGIFSNI